MLPLVDSFAAYVQQLTGQAVRWLSWSEPRLPRYLSQRYEPLLASVADRIWLVLLLHPADPSSPVQLTKQLAQLLERVHPQPAGTCLVAAQLPPYLRTRLVELGQPFVVPGRQLFWPALGSAETVQRPQRTPPRPVGVLRPAAQQLLIALLLKRLLPPLTVSATADALQVSAASVSQSVKALEGSGLLVSELQGRERIFSLTDAPHVAWEKAQPLLRTPVRKRLRLHREQLPAQALQWQAGETALAHCSNLAAPAEPGFAVASRRWRSLNTADATGIPMPDTATCILELWRYAPDPIAGGEIVDPLSLYLSLRDHPDERVQLALQELLESLPW